PRGKTVVNANTCSAFTYVAVTTVLPLLHNGNTVPAWPSHRDGPCRFGNFAKSFITPTGSSFFLFFQLPTVSPQTRQMHDFSPNLPRRDATIATRATPSLAVVLSEMSQLPRRILAVIFRRLDQF